MYVIDNCGRVKLVEVDSIVEIYFEDLMDVVMFDEVFGDMMGWFSLRRGNRINRVVLLLG